MNFGQAVEALKDGKKVKLPSWGGYWQWAGDSIKMHCKDGRVIDIREMENVEYTMSNIASDEWTVADESNCPVLGGQNTFSFGEALKQLKKGRKVARKGWNGKGIFLELQVPDEHSKMTHPYIYIDTTGLQTDNPHAPKNRVPWLASQTDMLAEDWMVIE